MRLGVIGYGGRVSSMLEIMFDFNLGAKLVAITDTDYKGVCDRLAEYNHDINQINFYSNAEKMLDTEELDGVLIGTRCNTHTEYATQVLSRNIPLFLEKPVSINMQQLNELKEMAKKTKAQTVVSFPLRVSPIVQAAKKAIDAGEIGEIEHISAFNYVPYGGVYYHNWYRDESITGGLFMQKATHDIDYLQYLMNDKPEVICAMESKQIFKGNKPVGLLCSQCDERNTCCEGPFIMNHFKFDTNHGDKCCFAIDTGNHDSASLLIRFKKGAHLSYTQNFFARKTAASRGAKLSGYKGTLEFDWYTDELILHKHDSTGKRTYKFNTSEIQHGGGDQVLAYNFIQVIKKEKNSVAPLESGILSALTCLKAKESAESKTFVNID